MARARNNVLIGRVSAAALAVALAAPIAAQTRDVPAISEWNYDRLYDTPGLRAEEMLEAEVYDQTGEAIGEVENVFIDQNDQIVAITAEVGGLWDIGDTHVVVPWDQVEITPTGFNVPINEDNVEDYDLWADDSIVTAELDRIKRADDGDLGATPRIYRLDELLDDYATVEDGGYGFVEDAIFSQDGKLEAVVVDSRTGGRYAYPFRGVEGGYAPAAETYDIGYDMGELDGVDAFDWGEYESVWE